MPRSTLVGIVTVKVHEQPARERAVTRVPCEFREPDRLRG